ncbi:UNVERIFIED_ORG: hypothetical protein ABRZ91_000889 [Heyndrickxia coagulans]
MGDFVIEARGIRNEKNKSLACHSGCAEGRYCSAELVEERVARMAMN